MLMFNREQSQDSLEKDLSTSLNMLKEGKRMKKDNTFVFTGDNGE